MVFALNPGDEDDSKNGDTRPTIGFSELTIMVAWFVKIAACLFSAVKTTPYLESGFPRPLTLKEGHAQLATC
jgi:hypothetical protein